MLDGVDCSVADSARDDARGARYVGVSGYALCCVSRRGVRSWSGWSHAATQFSHAECGYVRRVCVVPFGMLWICAPVPTWGTGRHSADDARLRGSVRACAHPSIAQRSSKHEGAWRARPGNGPATMTISARHCDDTVTCHEVRG